MCPLVLKVMYFVLFASCFSPLSLCFTSTTRLFQLHHGSWTAVVWAEGRGGWWESEFFDGSLWGFLFMLLPYPLKQCFGLRERCLGVHWGVVSVAAVRYLPGWLCCTWTDDTLRMGMRVCHHGDRQSDRHIEESVAVLPSVPPPSPVLTPHWDTGHPHVATLPL